VVAVIDGAHCCDGCLVVGVDLATGDDETAMVFAVRDGRGLRLLESR
jgi:hypothetical protein